MTNEEKILALLAEMNAEIKSLKAEVNALLQKYGVQSLQELKPNQLGAVALELRGLGANI